MASKPRNMPEQEHSIKVRSNELFVPDAPTETRVTRPFPDYLRETPAQPLSAGIKAIIWILGIVVALLFVTALWRVVHRHGTQRAAPRPTVRSTWEHHEPAHRFAISSSIASSA
jgi:hypothetical protein